MFGRRRPDPLKVILVLVLLVAGGIIVVVSTTDPVIEPAAPAPEPAAPVAPAPAVAAVDPALEEKLAKKPARTRKGKLLKKELEKRAGSATTSGSGASSVSSAKDGTGTRVATGGVDVVLSGDAVMRRAFTRKLAGVRIVEGSGRGFYLSLKNDTGVGGGTVFSKCTAAVSALPQKKLLASLSARADIAGEGMSDQELKDEASAACAASLAEDVSGWLRAHR